MNADEARKLAETEKALGILGRAVNRAKRNIAAVCIDPSEANLPENWPSITKMVDARELGAAYNILNDADMEVREILATLCTPIKPTRRRSHERR